MPLETTSYLSNKTPAPLGDVQWFFFDLDGTLADSITGLDASIRIAFQAVERTCPAADLRQWIGPGVRTILRNLEPALTDAELDTMEKAFRSHYDTEGILQTEMFGNVAGLLHTLKDAGRNLYIITNKPKLATGILLRSQGLHGLFDAIVSRNSRAPQFASKGEMLQQTAQQHNADPALSVMVGDTAEDAEAAAYAGMRFVHAAYGYGHASVVVTHRIQEAHALLELCGLSASSAPHHEQGPLK